MLLIAKGAFFPLYVNTFLGIRNVDAKLFDVARVLQFLIRDARQFSLTAIVFLGIVIFALVGKATDSLVRVLEKRWLKWRDNYSG